MKNHTPAPFLSRALSSIANSEDPQIIADMLVFAEAHLDEFLEAGAFTGGPATEAAFRAIIPAYEKSKALNSDYLRDLAIVDAIDEQPDAIMTVRSHEQNAAFALGLALGLRMGGAR